MSLENPFKIVGAKKNPDGSQDYSQAAILKPKETIAPSEETRILSLPDKELKDLWMQVMSQSDFLKNLKLKQVAKKKNIPFEKLLQDLRIYTKTYFKNKEKGSLRHYHRTSMQSFRMIAETGSLLSRTNLKKEKPEIDFKVWSSSDSVMMTRDKFDSEGKLIDPGFKAKEVVGAVGSNVMFVFSEEIMNQADYDVIKANPTMEKIPIQEFCEAVLVNTTQELQEAKDILSENNLTIPVYLKSEWQRN